MNKRGPYLGIVAPNNFELNPLLASQAYVPYPSLPFIDFAGRRFRFGKISNQRVVIVMAGLGMVNAGVGTQLLVSLFRLKGVLHYGIAGNAHTTRKLPDSEGNSEGLCVRRNIPTKFRGNSEETQFSCFLGISSEFSEEIPTDW
ncbi:Uncharacterized protein Rs2_07987 [Raphanus sativus]|nr:Uncharacterized protein Rs2_07987 [Raphanus sativus]